MYKETTGTQGSTGTKGNTGAQGSTSAQGSTGTQGSSGGQGATGTQGPAPSGAIKVDSICVGSSVSNINISNGEGRFQGDITAYYSDARLKNFHGKIENSIDKIKKLNGYYFTGNDIAKSLGYNNDKMQVGVCAQEVEEVLPEIIKPAPIDPQYKTVQYEKLVPLLIEGIKNQQKQIDELKQMVKSLMKK